MNKDFIFLKILFIWQRKRKHKQGEQQAEGVAGSSLSKEPDVGLDRRAKGRHLMNWATRAPLKKGFKNTFRGIRVA